MPNVEKVKAFPTKIGNRTRVNPLSTPVHLSDRSLSKSSSTEEADRSDSNRGEVKCPCLQTTHAVVRSWWLYQQISAKQEGTINTQTSTTFLYTNVKYNEKETREKCHSQWPQKKKINKIFGSKSNQVNERPLQTNTLKKLRKKSLS